MPHHCSIPIPTTFAARAQRRRRWRTLCACAGRRRRPEAARATPELRRVTASAAGRSKRSGPGAGRPERGAPSAPTAGLAAPRVASRRSARFQLPLDSRQLLVLTPMQYLAEHVALDAGRKRLCRLVFQRHAVDDLLPLERVETALCEVLGASAPAAASALGGWSVGGTGTEAERTSDAEATTGMSFRAWCGAAALAERLAAATYATRAKDPPPEVEQVDLAALERRLIALGTAPRPRPALGPCASAPPLPPLIALLRTVRDA
ncbi:Uncharacterized protein GBIM_07275 [Gryllus bimaculatus]|nr:Uncharacterized protein GBIM_07275 [Gryllus bimaculatus]